MVYSIPDCFMTALICGFAFGAVYEALRIVRLVLRFPAAVFICDVVFFAAAAELVFRLSMSLGNYVRIYTVLGFGAGIFAYIVTIGRIMNLFESAAAVVWRRTIGRLLRAASKKIAALFRAFAHIWSKAFGKVADFFKKQRKVISERLQSRHKKVYNNKNMGIGERSEASHVIKATVRKST